MTRGPSQGSELVMTELSRHGISGCGTSRRTLLTIQLNQITLRLLEEAPRQ